MLEPLLFVIRSGSGLVVTKTDFNDLKQLVRELAEAQSPKRKEPHPFYMPVIINPMKLPNIERAFIRPEKITQYLLSENHSVGQYKARFFLGFGFSLPRRSAFPTRRG